MSLRKTVSLTSLLSFILLIVTSIFVYIKPHGKITNWTNWEVLGLDKGQWEALHTNLGILFIIACLIHTILNWNRIMAYLKNKAKKTRGSRSTSTLRSTAKTPDNHSASKSGIPFAS